MQAKTGKLVAVLAVGTGAALGLGSMTASHTMAATTGTVNNITNAAPIGNGSNCPANTGDINPFTSETNWLITTSNSRPWADVKSFVAQDITYTPQPTSGVALQGKFGATVPATQVTIDLCSSVPATFPAANGDSGVGYYFTWQGGTTPANPAQDYACGGGSVPFGGPPPRSVGTGTRGQPIFTGPFPACAGYRYFGFFDLTAPSAPDFGVGHFDPIGQLTFDDTEQTTHTPTNGNADPANIGLFTNPVSGLARSEVRLIIPQKWVDVVHSATHGDLWTSEQVYVAGAATAVRFDASVDVYATANATAPTTVCGLPIIGCTPNGVGGLLFLVESAPGEQACAIAAGGSGDTSVPSPASPLTGCPHTTPFSFDYGLVGFLFGFPLGALQTPVLGPSTISYTVTAGTVAYDPCRATDNWPSGIPGQGPGQSAGDAAGTPVCSVLPAGTTVPQEFDYESVWGRILWQVAGINLGGYAVPNGVSF